LASEHIDAVADIAVAANRRFTEAHPHAATQVGVISSTIRAMGIAADAVNIDCLRSGRRLVLILLDRIPGTVGIGIGQKDTVGQYELLGQVDVTALHEDAVLAILEERFVLN